MVYRPFSAPTQVFVVPIDSYLLTALRSIIILELNPLDASRVALVPIKSNMKNQVGVTVEGSIKRAQRAQSVGVDYQVGNDIETVQLRCLYRGAPAPPLEERRNGSPPHDRQYVIRTMFGLRNRTTRCSSERFHRPCQSVSAERSTLRQDVYPRRASGLVAG